MGIYRTDFLQHSQAVHSRHTQIKQGHTGYMFAEQSQTFLSAGGRDDLIPVSRKHVLQEIAIHLIVIDDQNFNHRYGTFPTKRREILRDKANQRKNTTRDET